jgi:serine/threonine-protein kinase
MLPVCDAVAEAHRRRITHRDLKPSNIFLLVRGKRPHPVVLDFGIAEDEQGGDAGAPPARRAVFGTPYYLAPEQVGERQTAGPASDQYALGVILYECLTGHPPYRGNKVEDVFRAIAAGSPPPPSSRGFDIPPELDAIVLRALSVDPKARFSSVAELRQTLQAFSSAATGATSGSYKRIPSLSEIEAAKTRLGMSPAIAVEAKTREPSSPAIEVGTKTRLGMSPAAEVEARTRAPSSPAIEVEKTPSPFVRTLTPEVEALDHADHAWFAAGEAHENPAAIPSGPDPDADLYPETSGATVPPVEVEGAAGGVSMFASRRLWIAIGSGVAVAGLVVMLAAKGGSSSAHTPPAALVQIEPAAAKPAADMAAAPAPAPAEAPAPAAPAPAPSEPAVAATPAPSPSEAPVAAPAPAPREAPVTATPAPASREAPVAAPAPAPREAPAPVVLASAPGKHSAAVAARGEAAAASRSRAHRSADKPRTRASSGVRLHNGVPLLD